MIEKIYEVICQKPADIYKWHWWDDFRKVVMIWDVMNRLEEKVWVIWVISEIQQWKHPIQRLVHLWKDKRQPIEEQPENLLHYVYDLIQEIETRK